jgi:hypothetical protein
MSSYEALHRMMGFDWLKRVRRFYLFDVSSEADLHLKISLFNPNKEGLYLERLPKPTLRDDERLYVVKVVPTNPLVPSRWTVWELLVSSHVSEDDLMDSLVMSTSHTKGLLVNPILEKPELLDLSLVY